MQRFDPDLPTRLIEILPEAYRRISYEEKYEWRDPPAGFFTKGGYLTIPSPDRLVPTWVQVPPSSNDPWDQTRAAFERFGTVADIMTPSLTIHRADGQQQGGQTMNTPSSRGTMGVVGTAMGGSTISGSGSASQGTGGMANNPPPANNPLASNPIRANPSGTGMTGGGGLPGGGGPPGSAGGGGPLGGGGNPAGSTGGNPGGGPPGGAGGLPGRGGLPGGGGPGGWGAQTFQLARGNCIKLATPEPFKGERKKLQSFKNDCNTWFTMFAADYQSDDQKILFIMSYIKGSDRVNQWKENYYAKYTDPITRAFVLPPLAQFSAEFDAAFELIKEKQKTNDDLFDLKQDKKSIDNFNIEFDNLVGKTSTLR